MGNVRETPTIEPPEIVLKAPKDAPKTTAAGLSAKKTIRAAAKKARRASSDEAVVVVEEEAEATVSAPKKGKGSKKKAPVEVAEDVTVKSKGKKKAPKKSKEPALIAGGHIIDEASVTRSTTLKKPHKVEVKDEDEDEFAL